MVNLIPIKTNHPQWQCLSTNNKEVWVTRLDVDAYTADIHTMSGESHPYYMDSGSCINAYNLHLLSYQFLLRFSMGSKYHLTSPFFVY